MILACTELHWKHRRRIVPKEVQGEKGEESQKRLPKAIVVGSWVAAIVQLHLA